MARFFCYPATVNDLAVSIGEAVLVQLARARADHGMSVKHVATVPRIFLTNNRSTISTVIQADVLVEVDD